MGKGGWGREKGVYTINSCLFILTNVCLNLKLMMQDTVSTLPKDYAKVREAYAH
jgi:hypothetical protein